MKTHHSLIGLSIIILSLLVSCNTNESCVDTGTCPDIYMERTDIAITGHMELWDNQVTYEVDDLTGPIDFKSHGNPASQFDISIAMESGYTLIISMVNNIHHNPWTQVGLGYTAYPGQDVTDKVRYVTAELRTGLDAPAYSTNQAGIFSAPVESSVFWVVSTDEHQIKFRIKGMTLYQNVDRKNKIEINGTLIGVNNLTSWN